MVSALRIRPFGRLLATYTLDEAADWLVGIALAVFVYERTGSALAVAALLVSIRFGPSLVLAPLAGRLAARRLGAVLAGLYAGAAVAVLALAASTAAPLAVILLLTFIASTLAATGRVITRTASSNLLDGHGRLRDGIAALNISAGGVNVLGPALAGAITVAAGTQASVLVAATVFTGLAIATWSLQGAASGADDAGDAGAPAGVRETLRVLTASPGIAAVLLAAATLLVLFCMDEPILLPYVQDSLSGDTSHYAVLLTSWGVGLLLGGLTFTLFRGTAMLGAFVLAGLLLAGAYLTLGLATTLPVAYGAAVVGGMGNGMFWGALNVVTLEAVPPAMRARTSGVVESLALATPGIGYLLGGGLSEVLSPASVYLLAGGLGAAVVLALGVSRSRPAARALEAGTDLSLTASRQVSAST
ncbi:MAG: MFS transporter [Solirubrobacteraceae bacterium]|nr:MFS transporter [Solirubrobacteraceae bacterium]